MGRPPKAKTNPEVKEIEATKNTNVQSEEATIVVDSEKEELRRQVAEQQKQMQELMAQMKLMAEMVSNKGNATEKPINEKRNITFINIMPTCRRMYNTIFYRRAYHYNY